MPPGGQRDRMLAAARARRPRRRKRPAGLAAGRWLAGLARCWRGLGRRGRLAAAGGAGVVLAVLAAGVIAWVMAGGPAPRARQYLTFTACLLTGPQGLAGPRAAPAWAGLEQASGATHAKVEYLPVMSGATEGAAAPYLATLVQRHCRVVVAAGDAEVAAVEATAARYPSVRFAVVGGARGGSRVRSVSGSAPAVRAAVAGFVTAAVHSGR